jgi:serine/threonine kinase 17
VCNRSVGVLAYVLLTGCSPFAGDTKQETFCNIGVARVDFPDDLFSDVSPAAVDFISKLLLRQPGYVFHIILAASLLASRS